MYKLNLISAKAALKLSLFIIMFVSIAFNTLAVTTSWKGTTSTSWGTSSNWTSGVPTATVDAIIGDANFTGTFQPLLSASKSYCKSLTIGNAAKVSVLSMLTNGRNLTVSGDIIIGANGTITHSSSGTLSLTGNWNNTGTYNVTSNSSTVTFSGGATQTITGATTFRKLTINAGSTTTLNTNITVATALSISGTLDPNDPTFVVTLTGTFIVNANGKIRVKASTLAGNYSINPTTLNKTSTVEYASATINQTVAALSYGTLRISGGTIKTVAGNFNVQSSGNGIGNINIAAGTLDLLAFTVNRGATGSGTFTLANACTLRVAGTFPANFTTYTIGSTSLTEYYGGNQTVVAKTYGNLTLSSSSGAVTKTMPATAFTIAGNLISSVSAGTLSFTAGNAITVNGTVTLGSSTTFDASSFSHLFKSTLTNNGTLTGNTSTITLSGLNATMSGTGTYNLCNLQLTGTGVTAASNLGINISGNLSTSGAGTFTHTSGGTGTVTMTGTTKTISGLGFIFDNLTISNTSSTVSTASSLIVMGNITVNALANFNCTAGTTSMKGVSKTISNAGTLTLFAINFFPGSTITTSSSFSIKSNVSIQGAFTASAGTITFSGTSLLTGTLISNNVTLNGTGLSMGSNSIMRIANAFTITSGAFDATTSTPNTVEYNGTNQTVVSTSYYRLILSNGGTKTAGGACTINDYININSGVIFSGSTFTHSIAGDWINGGTFTAGTSTVQFVGAVDSYITGATTFNIITVNKTINSTLLTLNNNVSVATINMTSGEVHTGSNTLTITTTRTGNGIILGTITRTHAYTTGVSYAFESPNNTILFATVSSVTTITITINAGSISDFPFLASILNKEYVVNVPSGTYNATLRLHYLDSELNGNNEANMNLWKFSAVWAAVGKSGNSTVSNYVEQSALTNINFRWTLCDGNFNIAKWTGATSTSWATASNWTAVQGAPALPPSASDIAQIGVGVFTNQPNISTAVSVRGLQFQSGTASTLTFSAGGSFTSVGSVNGTWSSTAIHTINAGAQILTIGGDLELSDGVAGDIINLNISTGTVNITNNLVQTSGAAVAFTGAGNLNIGSNYNYTSGTFTCGTSTVSYNGALAQNIAPFTYNNLTINKTSATALISSPITINGNLALTTGGQLDITANITIAGNVSIGAGTILNEENSVLSVGGNWTSAGTFIQGGGTIQFNGTGNQNIGATTFNSIIINKASGTAFATGNILMDSDVNISLGALDIVTYSLNRIALGGILTIASGATLKVGGSSNLPTNFDTQVISPGSTIEYNGTVAQSVATLSYGNLVFSNGGATAKTLTGPITISGDITINSGATFNGNNNTITLLGNWTDNGVFIPGTGTVIMSGVSKTISGTNNSFNDLLITGSYTTLSGSITTISGNYTNTGTFTQGSDSIYFYGDFLNTGTVNLNGVTDIMGVNAQTLSNNGTLTSGLSGVINYNGTIAPLSVSTSPPQFATVNINNTDPAGLAPVQPWLVVVAMNVNAGATFNGNGLSHTILGSFSNNGTVLNPSGTFNFTPSSAKTINTGSSFSCTGTVNYGGTGQITLAGSGAQTLGTVNITNTSGGGITASSDWNLSGGLLVGSGATFYGGTAHTINLSANFTGNGTFDGGTSTVIMNDTASIAGVGTITFNNITIASMDSAAVDFNVAGNFVNNGSYDPQGYAITFTGSSPSSISGTTTPVPFADLIIAKSGSTVTAVENITISGDLTINSGATLLGSSAKTISLEGDWLNAGTFSETTPVSTVLFIGASPQNINGPSVTYFGNVVLNNATGASLLSNHTINGSLTLQSGILTSNGYLTINLDKGAIAGTGAGNITGNINTAKTIPSSHYHFISSPLIGKTISDWNDNVPLGNGNYYYYDETLLNSNYMVGWTKVPSIATALSPMQGFALYYTTASTIMDMTGTYDHSATLANVNLTLSRTGATGSDGWNLVGNPYPSPIDWNAASGWTKTNIYNAIYYWDPTNQRYASYVTTGNLSTNGGTQYIPAMQAFWVRVDTTGGGNKSIPFGMTSAVRVTSTSVATPSIWRMQAASPPSNILKLKVRNDSTNVISDETIINFNDTATDFFDGNFDAYKMLNEGNTPSLYTLYNQEKYSINSLPKKSGKNVIPVRLEVALSGNYTISANELGVFGDDISVLLVDTLLHNTINLKKDTLYSFQIYKEDTTTRFFLNFNYLPKATDTNKIQQNVIIGSSDNTLNMYFINPQADNADVLIINAVGQVIFKKKLNNINSGKYEEKIQGVPSGIYFVKVTIGGKTYPGKIFLE